MDLFLKDKTVIITGASQGLGKASALAFAQEDVDWQAAFEQNLLSVVRASRAAIPYMQENTNGGRIVNITSSSIKQAIENLILSNTMRPGVLGLTKSMAQEFAADQILVNTVGPGKIATDRITQLMEATAKKKGE